MQHNVGDVVRIKTDDPLRGGETATIQEVLPERPEAGCAREYVVAFQNPPRNSRRSKRFMFCIYREEQLASGRRES
jgi:hypothetical protein